MFLRLFWAESWNMHTLALAINWAHARSARVYALSLHVAALADVTDGRYVRPGVVNDDPICAVRQHREECETENDEDPSFH